MADEPKDLREKAREILLKSLNIRDGVERMVLLALATNYVILATRHDHQAEPLIELPPIPKLDSDPSEGSAA